MTNQTNLNQETSQEVPDDNAITRFNNNLKALEEHAPDIYETIRELISSCYVETLTPEIIKIRRPNREKTISISAKQRNSAIAQMQNPDCHEPTYLVIGLGAGDELRIAFDATQLPIPELPNYKLPIYVVEPEPAMLIVAMYLHDMRALFESQRVQWFIGEQAASDLADYLQTSKQTQLPTHIISNWYPAKHPIVCACRKNTTEITNKNSIDIYRSKMSINKYYKTIDNDGWRDIFTGKNRPLRVMGWTSRFTTFLQYCMRDLLAGFEELGHHTIMHIEESDIHRTTEIDTLSVINEFQPDLIIIIDHNRDEYKFLPTTIPFMNWIQDLLPNIIQPNKLRLYPHDFIFVFGDTWVELLKSNEFYKNHNIHFLPLGINKSIYKPIPNRKKDIDVLYVSHIMNPAFTMEPFHNNSQKLTLLPTEEELIKKEAINHHQLIQFFNFLYEEIKDYKIDKLFYYSYNKEDRISLYLQIAHHLQIMPNQLLLEYFDGPTRLTNDIIFRVKTQPIRTLLEAGLNVRTYGKNWEKIPDFSAISHGPIENGKPLNKLMNQAKICLNNSPGTSFHMRALEILGSGGFMISRKIEKDVCDITKVFPEFDNVVLFKNEEELVSLAKAYSVNDSARNKNAQEGYQKAIAKFNYATIANKIISTIGEELEKH